MIVYLNKKWKIERTSVIFVFFEKIFLSVKRKLVKKYDDDVLSWIKGIDDKIYHVENDQKKRKKFTKMFVWIKEDRNSVTRPKSENWKNEKKSN